jgi:hypothetical protein
MELVVLVYLQKKQLWDTVSKGGGDPPSKGKVIWMH